MKEETNIRTTKVTLANQTLADIVKENIRAAIVFEEYGLDFCCRGKRPLDEVCKEKDVDIQKVLNDLQSLNNHSLIEKFDDWELDFLSDYIIYNHHTYVRKMLPIINAHSEKVSNAHGENHPEVKEITELYKKVAMELQNHMMKEERILFPYIKSLANAKKENLPALQSPFGSIANPIKMMEMEHEFAGDALSQIKNLSKEYTPPADACNTFKAFYSELKEFEEDLHKHIHLENNILFPKAIELESEML
jgi:regulator of cell morphogenesis and NO signaling